MYKRNLGVQNLQKLIPYEQQQIKHGWNRRVLSTTFFQEDKYKY